jgi:hypothetical protein
LEEKSVKFVLNRNPIGKDEIDGRRKQPRNSPGGLPIADAFQVVVDGFTADELQLTQGSFSSLNVQSKVPGMVITPCTTPPYSPNKSATGLYGTEIQRFTFYYNIDFPDETSEAMAFNVPGELMDFTLSVTAGVAPMSVSNSALLTLIQQPDPFILHGDPSWLSIDLRVFPVREGQAAFPGSGVTLA